MIPKTTCSLHAAVILLCVGLPFSVVMAEPPIPRNDIQGKIRSSGEVPALGATVEQDRAAATRIRLVWARDPSSTITVSWDQPAGGSPVVHYGPEDFGRDGDAYPNSHTADRVKKWKGMMNHHARLTGLRADTAYYFVIEDSEGVSDRYWFRTAPDSPKPFTFIVGGDSRNNQVPRRRANQMVAKLRPLFVAFTGDMIDKDRDEEWMEWFDDWGESVSGDGRMYPLLPHRGNHEHEGNTAFYHLFDTTKTNYYALGFGGTLLRYIVLNSEMTEGGRQAAWLENDLKAHHDHYAHLVTGYHKPMRPHITRKSEGTGEYNAWAELFYTYGVDLACESDSHLMKRTLPLRPTADAGVEGYEEGFAPDLDQGTVYIGEGCWGAPLRSPDDDKAWTVGSGRFNGFDWVHVLRDRMEVFTVRVDEADEVASLTEENLLTLPVGIRLWNPSKGPVRLVVDAGGGPITDSFAQWQLDQFGNTVDSDITTLGSTPIDPLSQLAAFAFNLAPHEVPANLSNPTKRVLPVMKNDAGRVGVKYQRPVNSGLTYRYAYTTDRQTWFPMGEDLYYQWISGSDGSVEEVLVELRDPINELPGVGIRVDVFQ